MLPYPHFPDLRGDSINPTHPITAGLEQLTMNWTSPLAIDREKNKARTVAELLKSSAESWTSDSHNLIPDYAANPQTGFAAAKERQASLLAAAIEGRFESFYTGLPSPLSVAASPPAATNAKAGKDKGAAKDERRPDPVIEHSPESARLVVIASNTFATDTALGLASEGIGTMYTKPVDFVQNAIDWALEDRSLMSLRGRNQFARTLAPLTEDGQRTAEYANYALALLGLFMVWVWRRLVAAADRRRATRILTEVQA
jgi:ABC-2 type transport system permease protein